MKTKKKAVPTVTKPPVVVKKRRRRINGKHLATVVAVPKVPSIVQQVTWHLALAPQDPEGLMEFKGPLSGLDPTRPLAVVFQSELGRDADILHELLKAVVTNISAPMLVNAGTVLRPEKQDYLLVVRDVKTLRDISTEMALDSLAACADIAAAEFSDEKNLLTVSRTLFSDDSVKVELAFGAIPVDLICPGDKNGSRGLRDLRRLKVKPIKPARAWHAHGQRPANPRYRERRQEA